MIINAVMSNQFKLKFIPGFRTFLFPEKKRYTLHRGI